MPGSTPRKPPRSPNYGVAPHLKKLSNPATRKLSLTRARKLSLDDRLTRLEKLLIEAKARIEAVEARRNVSKQKNSKKLPGH